MPFTLFVCGVEPMSVSGVFAKLCVGYGLVVITAPRLDAIVGLWVRLANV